MNHHNNLIDLSLEEQIQINAGSEGSKAFWKDVASFVGKVVHTTLLLGEAFAGGVAIVPGYVK